MWLKLETPLNPNTLIDIYNKIFHKCYIHLYKLTIFTTNHLQYYIPQQKLECGNTWFEIERSNHRSDSIYSVASPVTSVTHKD